MLSELLKENRQNKLLLNKIKTMLDENQEVEVVEVETAQEAE
jgi:hypothetical protein